MSKHFIPGLLFGCGAFPVIAPSVTEAAIPQTGATARLDVSLAVPGDDQSEIAQPPTGWSKPFKYWSSRSQSAIVEAINAEDRESAELHELRTLVNVWKALGEITDWSHPELEV